MKKRFAKSILIVGVILISSCAKKEPCPRCIPAEAPECHSVVDDLIQEPRQPLPQELLHLLECIELQRVRLGQMPDNPLHDS